MTRNEGTFKKGHIPWNKNLTKEKHDSIKKISESRLESKNPMWKGEDVGRRQLHRWVSSRFPKPNLCMKCKKVPPYDLANNSGKYLRDLSDWEWLCRCCHMERDGRLDRVRELMSSPEWSEKRRSRLGKKHTEKSKKKMSETRKRLLREGKVNLPNPPKR